MKKYIFSISIVILLVILGGLFLINNKKQSLISGQTITTKNHSEIINCNNDYKNVLINLKVDNTNCNEQLKIKIMNPNGNIVDNLSIKKNDNIKYEKKIKGIKGQYKIEFNKNSCNGTYAYTIDFNGNN